MFLGFGIDAWITIITMVVMLSILLFTRLRSDLVFLGAISILYVTGVLDVNEALSGFSSTTVAVIGVMFVLVAGLTYTGVLHWIVKRVLAVPDDEPLLGGDRLIFAGQIEELLDMKLHLGLVNADHHMFSVSEEDIHRQLLTAYVNFNSSLIGTKLGDSDFEKKNNITLVAVSRRGKRIEQPPRQVVLQAGDTLLLACPPRLHVVTSELKRQLQFFDSTDVSGGIGWRTVLPATIMIAMVTLVMFDVLPLLAAGLIAAGAMLVFRCCTPSQAMDSINWSLLVTLAASIVLALAIQKTGIAENLAKAILDVSGSHPLMVMIAVCLAATIITEFFSNAATAAMIVPVMYSAAQQLGYDPYPFVIALMLTVCTGFLMPFSSSLYMMVYSAGGYRFSDFMRIGLPVKVVVFITYIVAVSIVYPFTPI